jgi:hypothetical protein
MSHFLWDAAGGVQLKCLLHDEETVTRALQGNGALEPVEHFQVLDGVAFDSRPEALANDSVEIDE